MMSGYTFKKEISLGNVVQIGLIAFGITGGYFMVVSDVQANTEAHQDNRGLIEIMKKETDSLDVLTYKVDANAKTLARIESKLDE